MTQAKNLSARLFKRRRAFSKFLAVQLLAFGLFAAGLQSVPTLDASALAEHVARAPHELSRVATVEDRAAQTTDEARDRELVKQVSERMLANVQPVQGVKWPPVFYVPTNEELRVMGFTPDSINAGAFIRNGQPMVALFPAFMSKVVRGNADALAFVVGHEIAHHTLGHTTRRDRSRTATDVRLITFGREQEIDADMKGMEMALAAGFSHDQGLVGIRRMIELGLESNSFEGLDHNHPTWKERLQFIDREQVKMWRAMAAFDNGVFFLNVNQYMSAERSFEKVIEEFPKSYDAHSNLGYARLMQYCDGMDAKDLRRLGLGHLLVGGFYARPDTIFPEAKGIDEQLWRRAVASLEAALKLNPNLTLAHANLGVAYLVAPRGKDLQKAGQHLQEALRLMPADKQVDEQARAAVYVNAAVLEIARGRNAEAANLLSQAEALGQTLSERRTRRNLRRGLERDVRRNPVNAAVLYNRALMGVGAGGQNLAAKRDALAQFANYLQAESSASFWWDLGYERYAKLGSELNAPVETAAQLKARSGVCLAPVASVKLSSGALITLSDSFEEARGRLGQPDQVLTVVPETDLVRLRYGAYGVELLGTRQIMAIFLSGANAPALEIRPLGPNPKVQTLRIGMTNAQVMTVLGTDPDEFPIAIDDPKVREYRYYQDAGIALRLDAQGRVSEIVLTQIPLDYPCHLGS